MALKDKLMTLEDFKAVRDVDVASNSAQFTEIKADLEEQNNVLTVSEQIDYTEYIIASRYISPSLNTWKNNIAYSCAVVPLPQGIKRKIRATANDNYATLIAFLTSGTITSENIPDYAAGETGLRTIAVGKTGILSVPEDADYLYIYIFSASGEAYRAPASIELLRYADIPKIDSNLQVSGMAADALVTGDAINSIINLTNTKLVFDIISGKPIRYDTGLPYNNVDFASTGFVRVEGVRKLLYRQIVVPSNFSPVHGIAFYDSSKSYISGIRSISAGDVSKYIDNVVDVPQSAKYARFSLGVNTSTYGDFYVYEVNPLKTSITEMINDASSGQEQQETSNFSWVASLVGLAHKTNGKLNVAARMRLLCDTEWTPIAEVPRQRRGANNNIVYDGFPAGEKQKGIPYGAQLTYEQWMGKNISFETFLSAIANPNSVMYDFSRVGTAYRQSAWYSVNCSKAVSWALGIKYTYTTGSLILDQNVNLVGSANQWTAEDVQIGDVLEKPGTHTAIITDLVYNTFGELSQIEVSEAVTPTCRRKRWNLYGELDNFWTNFGDYRLERYGLIDDVPPINMEAMFPYISKSLGLNYGNKSNYNVGDTVKITLLSKPSNSLVVSKDGATLETIDVSTYSVMDEVEYQPQTAGWYDVGFNGDKSQEHVGFCVNSNSAVYDSSTERLTFTSSTSALYMVSYSKNSSREHISDVFPSSTDLTNGYISLTIPNNVDYIHATFANDYGKTIIEIALS